MFSQYFGQYLFNEGILSAEQLYNIFEYKETIKVKLGTLAMTSGLMSAAQVEEVLSIQQTMDLLFGEIAVNKGYLTAAQVEQLLNAQKNTQVTLNQAIADRGYLSLGEIEKHLENFYHQQSSTNLSAANLKVIEANDVDAVVKMFLNFSDEGEATKWYYEYVAFTLRNAIRFLNESPAIHRMSHGQEAVAKHRPKQTVFWLITQNIPGEINLKISITMDAATLLEMARRFSKKAPQSISATESAVDIVAKYFNMHNNVFLTSALASAKNKDTKDTEDTEEIRNKLPLPETFSQKSPFAGAGYRIPTVYSFGQIDLLLENLEDEE